MDVVSSTHARQTLATQMDEVEATHAPVVISRQKKGAAVLLSLQDDNGLMETLRLLRSPRNTERLLPSIDELNRGEMVMREPNAPS
jgi:antitoxin YefM